MDVKIAVLEEKSRHFEEWSERHQEQDDEALKDIFSRLGKLERLAYISMGAIIAVGSVASFFGWNILKLLGK